jgi:hypothetical protein
MNKKGIIILVVIIVLVVIGYMIWGGNGSTVTNTPAPSNDTSVPAGVDKSDFAPVTKDTTDSSLITRLRASSVSAAETGSRVALVNGKAQFSSEGVKGSIALGDVAVSHTFGGINYAITTLGVTTGGTTYQYAVLFTDKNGTLTDVSYDLIGSGITVTGVRVDEVAGGLVVTASFKDGSGKSRSKIMVVENGVFNPAKDINL